MKQFVDQSTATRVEKAKRVLLALANPHDYKYFFGDGFPRHADLQQDAAAALEVLEDLADTSAMLEHQLHIRTFERDGLIKERAEAQVCQDFGRCNCTKGHCAYGRKT